MVTVTVALRPLRVRGGDRDRVGVLVLVVQGRLGLQLTRRSDYVERRSVSAAQRVRQRVGHRRSAGGRFELVVRGSNRLADVRVIEVTIVASPP